MLMRTPGGVANARAPYTAASLRRHGVRLRGAGQWAWPAGTGVPGPLSAARGPGTSSGPGAPPCSAGSFPRSAVRWGACAAARSAARWAGRRGARAARKTTIIPAASESTITSAMIRSAPADMSERVSGTPLASMIITFSRRRLSQEAGRRRWPAAESAGLRRCSRFVELLHTQLTRAGARRLAANGTPPAGIRHFPAGLRSRRAESCPGCSGSGPVEAELTCGRDLVTGSRGEGKAPGGLAADQVGDVAVAGAAQEAGRDGRAGAARAVHHDRVVGRHLRQAPG